MDESRKAFESWIASTTNSDLHRGVMLGRRESGVYSHLATENKWEAWQASRAAIEIDLPKKYFSEAYFGNGCCDDYANAKLDQVYLAVRAAGIKVKE